MGRSQSVLLRSRLALGVGLPLFINESSRAGHTLRRISVLLLLLEHRRIAVLLCQSPMIQPDVRSSDVLDTFAFLIKPLGALDVYPKERSDHPFGIPHLSVYCFSYFGLKYLFGRTFATYNGRTQRCHGSTYTRISETRFLEFPEVNRITKLGS